MARQIIFGTDVTSATTGGIAIYKKDANGEPVLLVAADTLTTAPEIQFCRAGTGECSPWINGMDIREYSGQSGVAQTAQSMTLTCVAGAAGTVMTFKFIDKASGSEPYKRISVEYTSTGTNNGDAAALNTAINAYLTANPGSFIATSTVAAAVVTVTGTTYAGPTATGNNAQTNIETAFDANGNAATVTVVNTAATSMLGSNFIIQDFEKELVGERSGDYYRVQQPNNLTYYAAAGTNYDVYAIEWASAYKYGQINKVDNNHILYIAVPAGPSTWVQTGGATGFESNLTGYLAHTPRYGTGAPVVAL